MAKSKEELIYDIENELVDPTTNKITGERVKARLLDMVDAMGTGGGGAMEYWSFPNGMTELAYEAELASFCSAFKAVGDGNTVIYPSALFSAIVPSDPSVCVGLAFDRNLKIAIPGTGMVTIGECLDGMGLDVALFGGVLITEEEFYTI